MDKERKYPVRRHHGIIVHTLERHVSDRPIRVQNSSFDHDLLSTHIQNHNLIVSCMQSLSCVVLLFTSPIFLSKLSIFRLYLLHRSLIYFSAFVSNLRFKQEILNHGYNRGFNRSSCGHCVVPHMVTFFIQFMSPFSLLHLFHLSLLGNQTKATS